MVQPYSGSAGYGLHHDCRTHPRRQYSPGLRDFYDRYWLRRSSLPANIGPLDSSAI
jgi:hypothetical protein